ncbi:agamous-like MADS-box protein AGL5 [Henckelia pumila]|uniref:agamous-like MADS-box protein AGL5 n=1 Tax=Henckelia pumila TaxID=405737 RepID=UPI003C6E8843
MELISKEKSRNLTFKKRKEGLVKKIHQLTVLCDIDACMIIYGSGQEKGFIEPEIWPENTDEIRRMIALYKSKKKDSIKISGLSDFFQDRAKKIEDELSKLRKKNMEAKYPTWIDFLNGFTEVQLREFAANLRVKMEDLRSRINNLKKSREVLDVKYFTDFGRTNIPFQNVQSFYNPGMIQRGNIGIFDVLNQQEISSALHIPSLDHNQELHSMNQNSMMMPMSNYDEYHNVHFGDNASTSGNISFQHQGFYEPAALDPMTYYSPSSLPRFYTPPAQYMVSRVLPEQIPETMPPLPGFF